MVSSHRLGEADADTRCTMSATRARSFDFRLAGALALTLTLLLAACAPGDTPEPVQPGPETPAGETPAVPGETPDEATPRPELSRRTVTAASVGPDWTVQLPTRVAEAQGYWEEEGLDVEITFVGPAPAHAAALIGRGFDFSIKLSTDTLIRANSQGEPVYAIAGSSNVPIHGIFANVPEISELRGRTVITDAPGGSAELLALDILDHHGISAEDVTLVPVSGTQEARVQAVLTNVGDAALGSVTDEPRLTAAGLHMVAEVSEVYPVYQWAVIAAHGALLEEHPDTVVAFLKGMIRAWQYIQDPANEQEILQILEGVESNVDVVSDAWTEALDIQRGLMTTDGSLDLDGVDVVLDREQRFGRVPGEYTSDRVLRLELLEQAQQELGL
jgi:ABC-type nitrate/sulfonate/bicarbonate transport system substrate-binding protein